MSDPSVSQNPDSSVTERAGVGTPRWVKVLGLAALALALLVVVLLVTGVGGHHGPGRHSGVGPAVPVRHPAA